MRYRAIVAACLCLLAPLLARAATPETVAVIGTGRVGEALGPQFARLGHPVVYGSRDPAQAKVRTLVARTPGASARSPRDAAAAAQIVVLAVPWHAAQDTVRGLGDLSGKVIIDATNAFAPGKDRLMAMVVDTSGGELIQSWAPRAKVVKAFNTLQAKVMADPKIAGGPVTLPLCGDDAQAKARVAAIARGMGFETADVGPMRHARWVEGMTILYLTPAMSGRPQDSFEFYLRPRPR
jgi:predicted dinucleotide-binding enzyme